MYYGGKERHGEKIARIVAGHKDVFEGGPSGYLEPFVGMAGVYRHIPSLLGKYNDEDEKITYLAGDVNKPIIEMWRACQRGWKPPTSCSEGEYLRLKESDKITPEHGFLGHTCSYLHRYLGTYYDKAVPRLGEYSKRVSQAAKNMKDVRFYNCDYKSFSDIEDFIIYCDPPYQKTQNHYSDGYDRVKFDNKEFWRWCEKMAENNVVLISERSPPLNSRDYMTIDITDDEQLYTIY